MTICYIMIRLMVCVVNAVTRSMLQVSLHMESTGAKLLDDDVTHVVDVNIVYNDESIKYCDDDDDDMFINPDKVGKVL